MLRFTEPRDVLLRKLAMFCYAKLGFQASQSQAKTSPDGLVLAWLALQDLIRNPGKHSTVLDCFNVDLAKSLLTK